MMRLATIGFAIALAPGCLFHLDRNAPGRANLATAPQVGPGEVAAPEDPGENALILSAGGFAGAGGRVGDGSADGTAEFGIEASIDWGELEKSHIRPDLLPLTPLPKVRYGLNFGWVIRETLENDFDRLETGPLYLEAHYAKLVTSVSAGYSLDPGDGSHGPQLTVSSFGGYAKASYRVGRGFDLYFGMVMKLPTGVFWSR